MIEIAAIKIPSRVRKEYGNLQALADSIKTVGLLHPIVIDENYNLVAGERRLRAVEMLGWRQVPTRTVKDLDELLKLQAERDENTCREDFRPTEASLMADKYATLLKPAAAQRKRRGKSSDGKAGGRGKKKPSADSSEGFSGGETREKIAESVGLSHDTLSKIREVIDAANADPSLMQIVEEMDRTGNVTKAARAIRRHKAVKKVAKLPSDKFRVIYADPPWSYGDSREGLPGTTGASAHYPSMTIQQLCDLPIESIVDDNAVLFLWTTSPLLFECLPVIKAWGFSYKSSFVWDKIKHNLGHYNSVRHEFLLVCTRGSCVPDNMKLFDSVQSIERMEHSEKPEEFREIIETLYPHGKRIELFARKQVEGWEHYGNEV